MTAQRRSENLQKAAVPVNVVTGSALRSAGITDPSRLSDLVPGLSVTPSSGGVRFFFIRGVGNFTATSFSDPTIAVNYDNVYLGRPTATSGLFYDLDRIEVLYGPQGTLYGRNATGGVINVIPTKPVLGQFGGFATASIENYDAYTLEGAVNIPVGDKGALRISGADVSRDGYQTDGTSDEKRQSARLQYRQELTPDLDFRLSGDYVHLGGHGLGPSFDSVYNYNFQTGAYVAQASPLGKDVGQYDGRAQAFRTTLNAGPAGRTLNPVAPGTFQDSNAYGLTGEINWKTGAGAFTLIPSYRRNEISSRSIGAGYTVDLNETDEQESVELRFAGNRIGIFDYTIGGLYYHEDQKGRYAVNLQAVGVYEPFSGNTDSYAAFGRVTAHLSDRLRLVGGVRYTDDEKAFRGSADQLTIVCLAAVNGVPTCPSAPLIPYSPDLASVPLPIPPVRNAALPLGASGAIILRTGEDVNASLGNSKATYRGAVEFDLRPQSLLYASVETGYRSGGFSFAVGHETFRPETITAYTVGMKNRFFDNRLQANIEGFIWKYHDQQLAHFGLDLAGNSNSFTENIGRSTNQGVDADLQFRLSPQTLLHAEVQYLDVTYESFAYQAPTGAFPVLTGCPQKVNAANPGLTDVNCSGFPGYNSPKWTLDLGAEHHFDYGDYEIILAADTQYRSSRYVGFEFLGADLVDANWQSNAHLVFQPKNGKWALEAFVRNIENVRYSLNKFVDTIDNAVFTGDAPPRTYGVRVSAHF